MRFPIPLLLLFAASALFAQEAAPSPAEFLHHPQKGEPYEFWSYQFSFDNGTEAWLTFSRLQVPAIGQKVAAELSFHNFKGQNRAVGKQFPTDQWTEDRKSNTISIRTDYYMRGIPGPGHQVRFATGKSGGYLLDIVFGSSLASFVSSSTPIPGVPLNLVVHIPRAQVTGRIAIGKDTLQVRGTASLIHTWHPRRLTDFAENSLSLFSPSGDGYTGTLILGKNGPIAGYVIRVKEGTPSLLFPKSISKNGTQVLVTWQDASEPALTIDLATAVQKYSVLSTVDSWMERQAAKIALGGDQVLLRGQTKTTMGIQKWIAAGFK